MPPAIIAAAIGAGGTIAGSLVGRGGGSSTSTTTPTLTPAQQQVQTLLANLLKGQLSKGAKVSQGERNKGRAQINTTFDGIGDRLESTLAARGFADSGKLARGFKDIDLQRANSFQDLEVDLKNQASQRLLNMLGLAQNFVSPTGSTTTATGSGPSGLGSAISGGANSVAMYLWLQNLLGKSGTDPTAGYPASPA